MTHHGSCHCGNIRFEVEGDISSLMECNCSICSKRGYLLYFVPRSQLKMLTETDKMTSYTFARHQIQHNFCSVCGCAPLGFGADPEGRETAAVNARCLDDIDTGEYEHTQYDGRSV